MKEEQIQINNIKTHLEMMLTPSICEHAVIDTRPVSGHSIDFQVFRLLSGYGDLLSEIQRLRKALEAIYNLAHETSTGPAIPDEYWDIRRLAGDALSDSEEKGE